MKRQTRRRGLVRPGWRSPSTTHRERRVRGASRSAAASRGRGSPRAPATPSVKTTRPCARCPRTRCGALRDRGRGDRAAGRGQSRRGDLERLLGLADVPRARGAAGPRGPPRVARSRRADVRRQRCSSPTTCRSGLHRSRGVRPPYARACAPWTRRRPRKRSPELLTFSKDRWFSAQPGVQTNMKLRVCLLARRRRARMRADGRQRPPACAPAPRAPTSRRRSARRCSPTPRGPPIAGGHVDRPMQILADPDTHSYAKSFVPSKGIHTRVQARALVLERDGVKYALVQADLGGVPYALTQEVAKRIAATGITADRHPALGHAHALLDRPDLARRQRRLRRAGRRLLRPARLRDHLAGHRRRDHCRRTPRLRAAKPRRRRRRASPTPRATATSSRSGCNGDIPQDEAGARAASRTTRR